MDRRSKKILSVLLAILVGAGIIFFAWRGGIATYTVGSSPTNTNEWKDSLSVVPQTDLLKTLRSSRGSDAGNDATTTSDIVARELLINYVLAQKLNMSTTTLSDTDASAIAQTAINKIDLPVAKQYTESDLLVSKDNSPTAIVSYSKAVDLVIQEFAKAQTKNDIEIAFALPKTVSAQKRLSDIAQDVARYDRLIKGLLDVRVPSLIAIPHLHLVQKYVDIKTMIMPMSEIFSDPLKALAALSAYRQAVADLSSLNTEFQTALSRIQ